MLQHVVARRLAERLAAALAEQQLGEGLRAE
jgi:hypothetical protein